MTDPPRQHLTKLPYMDTFKFVECVERGRGRVGVVATQRHPADTSGKRTTTLTRLRQ